MRPKLINSDKTATQLLSPKEKQIIQRIETVSFRKDHSSRSSRKNEIKMERKLCFKKYLYDAWHVRMYLQATRSSIRHIFFGKFPNNSILMANLSFWFYVSLRLYVCVEIKFRLFVRDCKYKVWNCYM